jgi:hypothetical protein
VAALLIVIGWTATQSAREQDSAAERNSSEPDTPRRQTPAADIHPPRTYLPKTSNDGPIRDELKRLERVTQELVAERERIKAEQEDELYERLQAETVARKEREALMSEVERARQDRVALTERLLEIDNLLQQTDENYRSLEERLRAWEELLEQEAATEP